MASSHTDTTTTASCTVDVDGWIRIVGFGSLLSERSARSTFPNLRHFTLVSIPGACRVFAHAAPVFFERRIATPGPPYQFSSCAAEPWTHLHQPGAADRLATQADFDLVLPTSTTTTINHGSDTPHNTTPPLHDPGSPPPPPPHGPLPPAVASAFKEHRFIAATAFHVPPQAMAAFREREPEFSYVYVQPYTLAGDAPHGTPAIMCARGSDDLYRSRLLQQSASLHAARHDPWTNAVARHGIDTIWHHPVASILPCSLYLRHCVLAAQKIGVLDNFLDTSFLADRKTTIRIYLAQHPEILQLKPPPELEDRYNP